ncbi:MAG TPA: hypothetical protein VN914_13330 [Polyangia bacterium]|nr:hypothetical protein [Polyangia bacterium]
MRRLALMVAGLCLLAAPASAQPRTTTGAKPRPAGPPPAAPPPTAPASGTAQAAAPSQGGDANVKVERGAGGKKIYKITTEIRIEGKIQKPEAFYVLQKSSINYEWTELKQEFLPKILESVQKAPF